MYQYKGVKVIILPQSDIARPMRPNGKHARLVQQVIDGIPPWEPGDDPIEECEFPVSGISIVPMAVLLNRYHNRYWGIHLGHKAKNPQLSPFVKAVPQGHSLCWLTVELSGTPERPVLARAYGGEYTPPLPWMRSAKRADGGIPACREFWRNAAYVSPRYHLVKEGTLTSTPPDWFREP